MESNHRPSLAGTVFKTACAPCAPSSVVGAAGIEPATSCSQSKRATAALRPENGCWWPVPISGYAPRSMSRGPRLLIRVLSNRRHSYAVDSPTLNPCVTRAGFRHLRTRHRLTTQLRAVKSHPRFPAATEIPEVRYCAQGFNVGPRLSGVSCHLSPSDLSRNRTAPLPTKPRQASRNRTGTFFVGDRR